MQRRIIFSSSPSGWPERILTGALALLLVLLGLTFGALVLGVGLIAGLGLAARVWWLRRRLSREGRQGRPAVVVEGEYRVLEQYSATSNNSSPIKSRKKPETTMERPDRRHGERVARIILIREQVFCDAFGRQHSREKGSLP